MAQWVKASAVQPDDLSSILRTHMVERKNWLSEISSDLYTPCSSQNTLKKINVINFKKKIDR